MAKFEELGSLLFPAGKVAEEVQQGESARRRFAAVNDDGTFSVIDVCVYVTNEFADEDRDDAFWDYEVQTRSVVTDSLDIQNGLLGHPKITTMSTGGILRPRARSYVGPWTTRILQEIHVDLAILSVAGLSATQGLAAFDALEAEVKQHMVRAAKRLIVIANSEKIGVEHFHRFADLDCIDVLITNDDVSEEVLAPLRERIRTIELV